MANKQKAEQEHQKTETLLNPVGDIFEHRQEPPNERVVNSMFEKELEEQIQYRQQVMMNRKLEEEEKERQLRDKFVDE